MLSSKLKLVVMLVAGGMLGAFSQSAFAMQKVSDVALADTYGGSKYTGPCLAIGVYNCVTVDEECHQPIENNDPDQNPNNYRFITHPYNDCDGDASPTGDCDPGKQLYVTVQKQYYIANLLWDCGTQTGVPVTICTHWGCVP